MVNNPDYLKDAANRAALQGMLNNTDYSALSRLQQSREGMLARQKANQELMMKGLFNPLWHDVDFANYDTLSGQIFNDVSPLAYKSEVDLVRPYVDNLKASFMGVKDGWIHQGVSNERTDYEIQKNLSSIQNTPEYQKHLEVLQKQTGWDRATAEE
nr:MAG TPA: Glycophorin-binding protein [Crassvirales sp.]